MKNMILAALPTADLERIRPHLHEFVVEPGDVLHQPQTPPNNVYFLDEGVASISVRNEDGVNLELSIVGIESTVGERAIFEYPFFIIECSMLTAGRGHKMSPGDFKKEFRRGEALHDIVINSLEARITETAQTTLCNRTHTIEQRLSRWLLTLADRSSNDTLTITQEAIGNVLAVNRVTISLAATKLQEEGLIEYARGTLTIIDRAGLERLTCECYQIIKDAVVTYLSIRRDRSADA